MNLARQFAAFGRYCAVHDISQGEIALWYALHQIANSLRWQTTFNVAYSTLETYTKFSKSSIIRARKALAARGLIVWESRQGNQSADYQLVVLNEPQSAPQTEPHPAPIQKKQKQGQRPA